MQIIICIHMYEHAHYTIHMLLHLYECGLVRVNQDHNCMKRYDKGSHLRQLCTFPNLPTARSTLQKRDGCFNLAKVISVAAE